MIYIGQQPAYGTLRPARIRIGEAGCAGRRGQTWKKHRDELETAEENMMADGCK